jgi:nitrite reductase (NADH) small subunit/3-phenylpropionate/trans-cinnamate dioxygenase ferredoxin subunit
VNDFVPVGPIGVFAPRQGRMVTVNGRHIALFRLGDEFFALDNLCLHRGGPICEGFIDHQDVVTCPWHGWSYEVRTGTMVQDPRVGLSKHEIRIDGDQIFVRLSD